MDNQSVIEKDVLNKYATCMDEIKHRQNAIHSIIYKGNTTGALQTDVDFVCLQLRKIIELIALANLVSNKSEYSLKHENFAKHYHAKHIFKDIEKINPEFYPIPMVRIYDENGIDGSIEELKAGFVTRTEIEEIYDECSQYMHAENPFSEKRDIINIKSKLKDWSKKISMLLNCHIVKLLDIDWQIWVLMNVKGSDRPHVYSFKRKTI